MRIIRGLALAAVAAATAACATDRSTAPRSGAPSTSADVATTGSLVCDPTFAKAMSDAHAFFASPTDPIFATIQTMRTQYQNGGASAATDAGFDALQRIGATHLTSYQSGPASAGDALTKDLLACMSVGDIPSGFDVTSALTSGVYMVRGGSTDVSSPVLAFVSSNGQRVLSRPVWGIEPLGTWNGRFQGHATRFLIYGAPLPVSSFVSDPAAADPKNVAYTGFNISTIPAMPALTLVNTNGSPAQVRVGICIGSTTGSNVNLLAHGGTGGANVLALSTPSFCSTFGLAQPAPQGFLATLASRTISLLTPTPAYALFLGGVGGLPSGLSPFGPVQVSIDDIVLTFTQQPSNASAGVAIVPPVQVKATTASGTPIGGVRVTLHVLRPDGSDAGVTTGVSETTSSATSTAGLATFRALTIPQQGTYTLRADGVLNGSATLSATSSSFTVGP